MEEKLLKRNIDFIRLRLGQEKKILEDTLKTKPIDQMHPYYVETSEHLIKFYEKKERDFLENKNLMDPYICECHNSYFYPTFEGNAFDGKSEFMDGCFEGGMNALKRQLRHLFSDYNNPMLEELYKRQKENE